MKKVKFLVVDSVGFIKGAPIHEYAENVYTVEGAIKEIKDKATRERLQFLPYELKVKQPCPDAYKHVMEFSKKTGDYASLSATDLQIIALTYQLEKENVGTDHIISEPICQVTGQPPVLSGTQMSGFYYPKKGDSSDCDTNGNLIESKSGNLEENREYSEEENDAEKCESENDINETESKSEHLEEKKFSEENNAENRKSENSSSEEDEDDEEGWITPKNIAEVQEKFGMLTLDQESQLSTACITSDYSVQNVLLQMGLHVLSVDGMLIKNVRMFILRCFACFKTTNNMSKQFCPNCGNKTLKKVSVSVNPDGTRKIHINFRRRINIRGTRYSLPLPKGGRHSQDPVVCEDQKIPHNRPSKLALLKYDVLTQDYEAFSSPFAPNDLTSRAAKLGITRIRRNNQKKNPNEWGLKTGNKKRNR